MEMSPDIISGKCPGKRQKFSKNTFQGSNRMTKNSVKWTHKTTAWGGQREVVTVNINGQTKVTEFEDHDSAMYFKEGAEAAIKLFEQHQPDFSKTIRCIFCDDNHQVEATARTAIARHSGIEVPVTIVDRYCDRTGQAFRNTRDHDHRHEARLKLNKELGKPTHQRLPGVTYVSEGERGSAPVPSAEKD
jgi:hypothetical protein